MVACLTRPSVWWFLISAVYGMGWLPRIHVHNRHVPPQLEHTSGLPYLLSLLAMKGSLKVQSVGQLPLLLQPLSAPAQYVPPSTGSSATVACTLYFSGDHSGSVPRSTTYYYASAYSPAALHVITRAQFLSPISISTPYPAPHQKNVSSSTSTGGSIL